MTEEFSTKGIQRAITTKWLGKSFHYLPATGSTNELLKEMAAAGRPAGTMVLTDFQSQGKGRLDRRWEAPAGTSLLVSLLFRPDWPAEQATWLTMIAGLAAATAVQQLSRLNVRLKWPNDLVVQLQGQWHKLGGLLLEGSFIHGRLNYAILGSGINVNIPPEQLPAADTPATSLFAASGQPVSRLSLLNSYLNQMETLYDPAESGRSPQPAWSELLITLGQPVRVSGLALEQPLEGTAEGVDNWGRLLVRDSDGRLHSLSAGDVSLRG
jgi:BirA family biotin operon repressor/biotin-[acetyl-CoA-carboxylase] ligase